MSGRRHGPFALVALGSLMLGVVLTGCTTTQSLPSGSGDAMSAPPKVQRLVVAVGAPAVETTVPWISGSYPTGFWLWPMYEHLTGISPEGQDYVPMLATSWSIEPDGKSLRWKLRQGVPFHYGKGQMSAKDVVYQWKQLTATGSTATKAGIYRNIQDIDVVNDYEVVFRVAKPDSYLFLALNQIIGFGIVSKDDAESRVNLPTTREQAIAGTGPYQFLEWEPGSYFRLERAFKEHWRKTPDFPQLEYRFIKEPSTRLAALLAREVQIADLPPEMYSQATDKGFKLLQGRDPNALYVWGDMFGIYPNKAITGAEKLNPDPNAPFVHMDTPLLDVRVRRALSKALDRDALNKAFFRGKARPMYLNNYNPNREGWDPTWQQRFQEQYGYDPAKAKALLAEAGYGPSNPLKHEVLLYRLPYWPALPDFAESMANYYRAIGIDVTLVAYEPVNFTNLNRARQIRNMSSPYIASCRQLDCVGVFMAGSIDLNPVPRIRLPEIADYYDQQVRPEVDAEKRSAKLKTLGNMMFEQAVSIPFFWVEAEVLIDPAAVADWVFPGNMTGSGISHLEYATGVR